MQSLHFLKKNFLPKIEQLTRNGHCQEVPKSITRKFQGTSKTITLPQSIVRFDCHSIVSRLLWREHSVAPSQCHCPVCFHSSLFHRTVWFYQIRIGFHLFLWNSNWNFCLFSLLVFYGLHVHFVKALKDSYNSTIDNQGSIYSSPTSWSIRTWNRKGRRQFKVSGILFFFVIVWMK